MRYVLNIRVYQDLEVSLFGDELYEMKRAVRGIFHPSLFSLSGCQRSCPRQSRRSVCLTVGSPVSLQDLFFQCLFPITPTGPTPGIAS